MINQNDSHEIQGYLNNIKNLDKLNIGEKLTFLSNFETLLNKLGVETNQNSSIDYFVTTSQNLLGIKSTNLTQVA